jgi:hypothetical protein
MWQYKKNTVVVHLSINHKGFTHPSLNRCLHLSHRNGFEQGPRQPCHTCATHAMTMTMTWETPSIVLAGASLAAAEGEPEGEISVPDPDLESRSSPPPAAPFYPPHLPPSPSPPALVPIFDAKDVKDPPPSCPGPTMGMFPCHGVADVAATGGAAAVAFGLSGVVAGRSETSGV